MKIRDQRHCKQGISSNNQQTEPISVLTCLHSPLPQILQINIIIAIKASF